MNTMKFGNEIWKWRKDGEYIIIHHPDNFSVSSVHYSTLTNAECRLTCTCGVKPEDFVLRNSAVREYIKKNYYLESFGLEYSKLSPMGL